MKSQILGDYLFHFLPVIIIPPALYFLDNTVPPADLFRAGLLYPLFLLALKGLTVFFPAGNLKDRSLTRMIEHALLQGMLFATVIILFAGLDPKDQADLPQTLIHFVRGTLMMGALHLVASFYTQRSLRARGARAGSMTVLARGPIGRASGPARRPPSPFLGIYFTLAR